MGEAASSKTWIAITGATLGTFMAVLNIQIVNAALRDIQGALGAGADDVGWISTAYLVAEIVVIPLTGWLSRAFSVRRYLIANAALFVIFSVACAYAQDLGQMIALRALQGLAGGVLIPMAFTLILTLLPSRQRPIGLAIFAMAATVAPSFGPTLGGWLSGQWGWQAIFFVTVAPGAVMVGLLWISLDREPMQLRLLAEGDWLGIFAMALGLGALQVVLEEGPREDWLDSPFIARLAIVAALSLGLFVWRELCVAQPLLNLRLLARRNFTAGATAMFLLGVALFGSVFIQPLYLSRVQGYSSEQIGLVLAWTGLPQFVVIPLVPLLMKKIDARWLVALGFVLFACGNLMLIDLSGDVAADQLMAPNVVRALGQAILLTPLTTLAIRGIATADSASASALLTVTRNLGGALGIAGLQSFLERRLQLHASRIGEAVTLFDEDTRARLGELTQYFLQHGVGDPAVAWRKAVAAIGARVQEQASIMAFGDAFFLMGAAMILGLATVLLYRPPTAGGAASPAH